MSLREDGLEVGHRGGVVLGEEVLRAVGHRCERGQRALLHELGLVLQQLQQLADERVQVRLHEILVAALREVDHGGRGVRRDAHARIVHRREQRGQHLGVLLFLDLRAQVRAQLPGGVDGRPAHARVRVAEFAGEHVGDLARALAQLLVASLGDLREARERRVAVLPLRAGEELVHRGGDRRQHGLAAQRARQAVEVLLRDVEVVAVAGVLVLLVLGGMPERVVFDVQQHLEEDVAQLADVLRNLAHHAGRLLALLAQRHDELDREVAHALFEVLLGGDLQHRLAHGLQLLAQEARLGARHLHEHLEGLLRRALVAGLERVHERGHHRRDEVLELVAVGGRFERLHEAHGCTQRGNAHVDRACGQRRAQQGVQLRQVRRERLHLVRRDLREDVEGDLLEVVGARHALEEEAEQLGPGRGSGGVVLGPQQQHRQVGDRVAHLLADGRRLLARERGSELRLDGRLRLRLELGERAVAAHVRAANEDRRERARLGRAARAQHRAQRARQRVQRVLLARVEHGLGRRSRLVVGRHQRAQQLLEVRAARERGLHIIGAHRARRGHGMKLRGGERGGGG
mmetsp:Transcript_6081/g.24215  ORF Transcript_6081/g.24215 Transcript_6081/m.24215 type:complete len:573 (-) Transcript_6081:9-1727(-)